MKYNKPKIIAEIGCNHKDDLDIVFELIKPAGLSKLTRDLKASYNPLTYKDNDILDIEAPQREKLKWKER